MNFGFRYDNPKAGTKEYRQKWLAQALYDLRVDCPEDFVDAEKRLKRIASAIDKQVDQVAGERVIRRGFMSSGKGLQLLHQVMLDLNDCRRLERGPMDTEELGYDRTRAGEYERDDADRSGWAQFYKGRAQSTVDLMVKASEHTLSKRQMAARAR